MATEGPEYYMSAAAIAGISGLVASLMSGAVMYKWLFGGEGVKQTVSGEDKIDMETGKEQDIYIAHPVDPALIQSQDKLDINPGKTINGHPNPQPKNIPLDIDVDNNEDVSTLGDFTAGRSKIAYSTAHFRPELQDVFEEQPQGNVSTDIVSKTKTWTSGYEGTLASSYKLPEKSIASSASPTTKPESMTGTTATISQTSSSMDRSQVSGSINSQEPSSAPSYVTTPYSQVDIIAPPGKLGLILVNRADGHLGTLVNGVCEDSPLNNIVLNGDRIVAIDGKDISLFSVEEVTEILSKSTDRQRRLTVVSPIRSKV